MRLRTRLALAFALLALVPLSLVVPLSLARLRTTLSRELAARMQSATASVQESLGRSAQAAARAVDELAASEALEDLAREEAVRPGAGFRADTAEQLMRSRGLGVLALLDGEGRTLSSGHLPARRGDVDPALFAVTRAAPDASEGPVPVRVEVRAAAGLRPVPALVSARAVAGTGGRLWVVGGVLLDDGLAAHLARLSGAEVAFLLGDEAVARAGSALPPVAERALPLGRVAQVQLRFSRAGALAAERDVLRAFVLLAATGLALAVLLGVLVAGRITRPVEALTRGARQVAEGARDVEVRAQAGGEVGELVRTFNGMTRELQATTDRLVASERIAAWQEVARRLAHEIKNPLTPIQMSLETLLAAQGTGDPRFAGLFRESAGVVLEEVDRLRRIVDEFSRFARLPKPQLAPVELAELARSVLALYASPRAGVRLHAELAPGVHTRADRDQLTQVLVNLVKNAEEAMPSGGDIHVRVRGGERDALLEVEDTGPGVAPEDRAHIFEPYFTTKAGGSGLGLAIAARILQEHGGRLEVGGEPGAGARFTLVLPRSSAP
ncbi:HAMP domain-containing protein [Aggregicoccus sp. 17bor-14]|uniref:ATP-binding protein n=1 Tax=Myxococcaceae TaxID=31 RepID=UPI00129C7412|nr:MULTISPECIES: ATP-binding protein [Myxococcaceae]MBF5042678.1 HAMP domain-containing protein [Simulacricoccus sp. 17bor-14]MRI88446.1 HAMP domain-containing protein [Aggregicoccus sp. 17bor-14]